MQHVQQFFLSHSTTTKHKSKSKGDSRYDVPWEWQVSAKSFVNDVSCERSATPADECGEAQCSYSSPRGLIIWDEMIGDRISLFVKTPQSQRI